MGEEKYTMKDYLAIFNVIQTGAGLGALAAGAINSNLEAIAFGGITFIGGLSNLIGGLDETSVFRYPIKDIDYIKSRRGI